MTTREQLPLFPDVFKDVEMLKAVNVASVPQRSPFRYPGGKLWFVPSFRDWISRLHPKPNILVEPFAEGGIISLTALFENLVPKVIVAELDDQIAAVWESVANGEVEWLSNQILWSDLTMEALLGELSKTPSTQRHKAFQTILKNRTLHGGILAEGAGFLEYGENGKGYVLAGILRRLREGF